MDYTSRMGVHGPIVDWVGMEGAEVMQRLVRWHDVAEIVGEVRSGAVLGVMGSITRPLLHCSWWPQLVTLSMLSLSSRLPTSVVAP
jgi:hypothetical protein